MEEPRLRHPHLPNNDHYCYKILLYFYCSAFWSLRWPGDPRLPRPDATQSLPAPAQHGFGCFGRRAAPFDGRARGGGGSGRQGKAIFPCDTNKLQALL